MLFTLGLVLLSAGAAQAQAPDREQGHPGDRRTQALLKDITLTPAQQAQVDSIMHRPHDGEHKDGGDHAAGSRDAAGPDQRRERFRKQVADLRAVLNARQQAIFDRNVSEMRSRMEERGSGDSGRTKP
jgi:Spy/CpxP family protein refolding chaperone